MTRTRASLPSESTTAPTATTGLVKRRPPVTGHQRRNNREGERGQITLAALIFALGIFLLVSLVAFQGAKLRTKLRAGNVAEEAARAGAGQVDRQLAYRRGVFTVDPSEALRQAHAYLAAAGVTGTARANMRQINVTVTIRQTTPMLSIIGISQITETRTATADLVTGVDPTATTAETGSGNSENIVGETNKIPLIDGGRWAARRYATAADLRRTPTGRPATARGDTVERRAGR